MRVISRDGVRALTHRAVDREAGVPQGTTSYHASTRQALLQLVVEHLVSQSDGNAVSAQIALEAADRLSAAASIGELCDAVVGVIDAMSVRVDAMRARYALLVELEPGQLRGSLAEHSPVRRRVIAVASRALAALEVADPERRAGELFDIGDALIWQRTILDNSPDVRMILGSFLRGVPRA